MYMNNALTELFAINMFATDMFAPRGHAPPHLYKYSKQAARGRAVVRRSLHIAASCEHVVFEYCKCKNSPGLWPRAC